MAYIYAADIFCDACGEAIRKEIIEEDTQRYTRLAPADPDDETSYDSGDFPKLCGDDEESDCPQNCGSGENCLEADVLPSGHKIGKQFGSLSLDGVDYLKEAIEEGGEVAEFWADFYSEYL